MVFLGHATLYPFLCYTLTLPYPQYFAPCLIALARSLLFVIPPHNATAYSFLAPFVPSWPFLLRYYLGPILVCYPRGLFSATFVSYTHS